VSATRLPVTATVHAVPVITRSGGAASQTVNQFTAISAITYTASNATGIALSSGSFPTGVNGTPNGVVFTISGTPSDAGTFTYGITASHTNGCSSAASTGTITVNAVFNSSSTWSIGGYTWSDQVVAKPSGCSQVDTLSTTSSASPPAQYKINSDSGVERYYYNWTCAQTVCPSGWSTPHHGELYQLMSATDVYYIHSEWGLGGHAQGAIMKYVNTAGVLWASSAPSSDPTCGYYLYYDYEEMKISYNTPKTNAYEVRCVKD
jgi:hypothetical protein